MSSARTAAASSRSSIVACFGSPCRGRGSRMVMACPPPSLQSRDDHGRGVSRLSSRARRRGRGAARRPRPRPGRATGTRRRPARDRGGRPACHGAQRSTRRPRHSRASARHRATGRSRRARPTGRSSRRASPKANWSTAARISVPRPRPCHGRPSHEPVPTVSVSPNRSDSSACEPTGRAVGERDEVERPGVDLPVVERARWKRTNSSSNPGSSA